jgi:ABC-type Mn2+/Zn2+ transport system ATPase subunit
MLDAYEEDDLAIEFDPRLEAQGGRGDAQYKPINELSAGQRCTAVFPILLKLENAPLLIDQPEDNLDNRHIANKVANSVLDNKKIRQMLFTSHNANLVVMSDPENIIAFEAMSGNGTIDEQGFLAHPGSRIMPSVLDILDGGERALELRATKYGRLRKD